MNTNRLCILLTTLLLTASLHAQQDDPYDQRGVQFAAQGTDFWVCFPVRITVSARVIPASMW